MKIALNVRFFGAGKAPKTWVLTDSICIQRLYYIKSGNGAYRMPGGEMVPFEAGKLYIFPFNLSHSFVNDPANPIDHIFFDFLSTPPILAPEPLVYDVEPGSLLADQLLVMDREFAELYRCFGKRWMELKKPEIIPHRQMAGSLFRALLLRLSLIRPIPYSDDAAIRDTLEQIRLHYTEPLNVNSLAAASGYNVSYFIRRFKSVMGITPYAYLRSFRLIRAEELMTDGMTAAEAAEAVGYENVSSLRRALREVRRGKIGEEA